MSKILLFFFIITASVYSQNWMQLPNNTDDILNYDSSSIVQHDNYTDVNLQYPNSFDSQVFYQTVSVYKDRTYRTSNAYFVNKKTGEQKSSTGSDKLRIIETGTPLEYLYKILYP